jgi:hypothetical protein
VYEIAPKRSLNRVAPPVERSANYSLTSQEILSVGKGVVMRMWSRVGQSKISVAVLLLLVLASGVAFAQAPGSISGTLAGDDGQPVAAVVTANRSSPSPASGRAESGLDGTFTIANLPAGTYTLCVAAKGRGYLDPCTWSAAPPTVQISTGKSVSGYRLTVVKGTLVKVRLNDTTGVLSAAVPANQPAPLILLGFVTARGLFEPLALTAKDASGRSLEGTIPMNAPMSLQITGRGVKIADAAGTNLDLNGAKVTVQPSAVGTATQLTFNIRP